MRPTDVLLYLQALLHAHEQEIAVARLEDQSPIIERLAVRQQATDPRLLVADNAPRGAMRRNVQVYFDGVWTSAVASYDGTAHRWLLRTRDPVPDPVVSLYTDEASMLACVHARLVRLRDALQAGRSDSPLHELMRLLLGGDATRGHGLHLPLPPVSSVPGLSKEQVRGVWSVLRGRVTSLIGAPGAGKTEVLAATAVYAALNGARVLCVAPTNAAADVLHTAIARRASDASPVRAERVKAGSQSELVEGVCRIVTTTLALAMRRLPKCEGAPAVLIIDEASMVGAPSYLGLATYPAICTVIAGDPWQLPPVVRSGDPAGLLSANALERFGAVERLRRDMRRSTDVALLESHRLPPELWDYIASGWPEVRRINTVPKDRPAAPTLLGGRVALMETRHLLAQVGDAPEARMRLHAALWVALARALARDNALHGRPLFVMSPYRVIRDTIRMAARDLLPKGSKRIIDVCTVHEAQGLTAGVVGIDLLPSIDEPIEDNWVLGTETPNSVGARSMLVALTRASIAVTMAVPFDPTEVPSGTTAARLFAGLTNDTPRVDACELLSALVRHKPRVLARPPYGFASLLHTTQL